MAKFSSCRMPRSVLAMCASHFLSTWGDRMWSYAVAIFLVEIGCGLLLLPAIFGLVLAAVNFLGSTLVGKWVDSGGRLGVVKVSLIIQNVLVTLCAGFLILLLRNESGSFSALGAVYYASLAMVIVLGAAANLIGQATTIAVERDWVVVIANGDTEVLAGINAIMRRIDLVNKIVSPLPVSFLMSKSITGLTNGAIFIAAWNILSGFLEYFLLLYVYTRVPALARKASSQHGASLTSSSHSDDDADTATELRGRLTADDHEDDGRGHELDEQAENGSLSTAGEGDNEVHDKYGAGAVKAATAGRTAHWCGAGLHRFVLLLILPYTAAVWGWKVYRRQTVLRAGLSLSLLYMTVLGFNGITNGFLYSQGLEVWQVSVCQAAGALFGVLGTFVYHPIRRRVGVVGAGLVAIWGEALCLALCAASVFLSGNPSTVAVQTGVCDLTHTNDTTTTAATMATSQATGSGVLDGARQWSSATPTPSGAVSPASSLSNYSTSSLSNYSTYNSTLTPSGIPEMAETSSVLSTSLVFFLIGIVTARIGLWMFDLAITQLYQTEVAEEYRGTVGGVQSALNSNMDLLHFVLVISFPHPQQFGGLVIASFAAVLLAAGLYSTFARRQSHAPLCTGCVGCVRSAMPGLCCCRRGGSWSHLRDFSGSNEDMTAMAAAAHSGHGNTPGGKDVAPEDDVVTPDDHVVTPDDGDNGREGDAGNAGTTNNAQL